MKQYIKIYYNKVIDNGNGELVEKLVTELVPFLKNQTPYEESDSYEENFERFVSEAFECGFIMGSSNRAISILQIKEFQHNKPKPQQQNKKQKTKKIVAKTLKDSTTKRPESDRLLSGKEGKGSALSMPVVLNPPPPPPPPPPRKFRTDGKVPSPPPCRKIRESDDKPMTSSNKIDVIKETDTSERTDNDLVADKV